MRKAENDIYNLKKKAKAKKVFPNPLLKVIGCLNNTLVLYARPYNFGVYRFPA